MPQVGMMITDNTLGIWFVMLPNPRLMLVGLKDFRYGDYLAQVDRLEAKDTFKLTYRFRYYKDDKAFGSDDTKNWYEGELHDMEEIIMHKVTTVVKTLADISDGEYFEIIRKPGEDTNSFMDRFMKQPFVHAQKMTKEEAAKEGIDLADLAAKMKPTPREEAPEDVTAENLAAEAKKDVG